MKVEFLSLATVVSLSACGGSGGTSDPITIGPIEQTSGIEQVTAEFDDTTGDAVILLHGGNVPVTRDPRFDKGTFETRRGGTDFGTALFSSITDNTSALLFRPNPADITGGPTVSLARFGDSTIPTSGSATLTGDYQGVAQAGTEVSLTALIDGDATLNVDFNTQIIDGIVENRIARDPAGNGTATVSDMTLEDLTLPAAVISDTGSFTTATEGGGATLGPLTPIETDGTYFGLIGADGTEIVIGVEIETNLGAGGLLEVGAIAAGH